MLLRNTNGGKSNEEVNYFGDQYCDDDLENRCVKYCYRVRLEQTAKYAKENGYDTFSTTLLISPYQNHEALKKIGEEMAEKYGLTFLYRDFRPGFKEGQTEARELGLYMHRNHQISEVMLKILILVIRYEVMYFSRILWLKIIITPKLDQFMDLIDKAPEEN